MEAEGRIENLLELVAQMREYEREAEEPTLHGFLERIALVSDVDGYDADKGAISLMTVHTAKGLEFPVVFITGLEERIFPHARSVDDDSAVEEERRLCYVAVTRARKQLLPVARAAPAPVGAGAARRPEPLPARSARGARRGDRDGAADRIRRQLRRQRGPRAVGRTLVARRARAKRDRASRRRHRARAAPAARTRRADARRDPRRVRPTIDGGGGLQVGAKLRHPSFGVGEVRAWQGAGNDMKVTMKFPGVGVKTILARFLARAVALDRDGRARPRQEPVAHPSIRLAGDRLRYPAIGATIAACAGCSRRCSCWVLACTGDAGGGTPGSGGGAAAAGMA